MKKTVQCALTAFCCLSAAMSAVLPAAAAEESEPSTNLIYVDSCCPDFEPNGTDIIAVNGFYNNSVRVEIVQHSPERENLLLYQTEQKPEKQDLLMFRAEPGNYTITIRTPDVFNSASFCTYKQDFTIANPDYADSEHPFDSTEYVFSGKYLRTDDSVKSEAELLMTEEVPIAGTNSNRFVVSLGFPRYDRLRGDFNGDGVADLADAQLTLVEYSKTLSGKPSDAAPGVTAACDINGDGMLDVADAQQILMYYAVAITNRIPHWNDGTTSAQYDEAYTDRTCVYPGEEYKVTMRLVPYFSDEVPETDEERQTQITAANNRLKNDVQMHLSVPESGSRFYVGGEEAKTGELTFAPKLGETASFSLFNGTKIYPEICKMNESVSIKIEGIGTKVKTASLICYSFNFDMETDPVYYSGCYAEYNVNTNKCRVWKYQAPGTEMKWEQSYE